MLTEMGTRPRGFPGGRFFHVGTAGAPLQEETIA